MKRHADTTGLRRVLGSRIVLMLRVKFRRTRTCTALIPSQAEDARREWWYCQHPLLDLLTWHQRKSIILQVAKGLEYLHHKCSPPIIHNDVKSTYILLTTNLDAKVADFGLSKLKTIEQEDATHVTRAVKGTPGYLDPEYHETELLTEKSDAYAFGVVLLEILTGRRHICIAQGVLHAWRLEQFDNLAGQIWETNMSKMNW